MPPARCQNDRLLPQVHPIPAEHSRGSNYSLDATFSDGSVLIEQLLLPVQN
jgi:hypothetical protein